MREGGKGGGREGEGCERGGREITKRGGGLILAIQLEPPVKVKSAVENGGKNTIR